MATSEQVTHQREFIRTPGAASTLGQQFEYGLGSLVSLRCMNGNHDFLLGSNLAGFGKFDDIYLRLTLDKSTEVYLLQLKHKANGGDVSLNQLLEDEGNYSISAYYQSYCLLEDTHKGLTETHNSELLKETNFKDIKFVLYTNCSVEHKSKNIENYELSFSESMLLTNYQKSEIFHFGPDDEKIWNLRDDFGDTDRFHTFLSSLFIYSCQSHVGKFPDLIREQVCKCANVQGKDADVFYSALSIRMEKWWNDESTFLSPYCPQWNELLVNDLNSKVKCMQKNVEYRFKTGLTNILRDAWESCSFLNVIVGGVSSSVRCLKLLSELEEKYSNRYLLMDGSDVFQRLEQVLSVCRNGFCEVFVIDIPDRFDVKRLISSLRPDMCKIILVSENKLNVGEVVFRYQEDTWAFDQLVPDSQTRILNSTINFQGFRVHLKDFPGDNIGEIVSGKALGSLLEGHILEVGRCLPPVTNEFYIPRTLKHNLALPQHVLLTVHENDLFAVSGIPLDIPNLAAFKEIRSTVILSYSVSTADHNYDEVHPDRKKYLDLCSKSRKAVHWVLYVDGQLVWRESHGSEETPGKYAIRLSNKCSGIKQCFHGENSEEEWLQRLLLITGEPGMGKSTFLRHIAEITKQKQPSHWNVYVPLGHFTKTFYRLSSDRMALEDVMDIISKASNISNSSCPNFAKQLLWKSVQDSGNITVLLDAVDEISPSYFDHVVKLIELLLDSKVQRLWVSSRIILQQHLQRKLLTLPLILEPLSESDQLFFMSQYFTEEGEDEYAKNTEKFLEYTQMQHNSEGRHICDVPLHAQLMAETIKQQLKYNLRGDEQYGILRTLKLHHLYENFIHKKREHFYEKHGLDVSKPALLGSIERENDYFIEMHTKCALRVIFTDVELEKLRLSDVENDTQLFVQNIHLEKTGVIDGIIEGKPKFVHLTFAEYLVARWFLVEWFKNNAVISNDYQTGGKRLSSSFICKVTSILNNFHSWLPNTSQQGNELELLYEDKCSNIRLLFDYMLSENLELHEAVLSGNIKWMREILQRGAEADILDQGGRLALHLAASYDHAESAKLLLAAGSPVKLSSNLLGWSPLRYADKVRAWNVAEYLLQYGSDTSEMSVLRQKIKKRAAGYTNLMRPAFEGKIYLTRFILDLGIDVSSSDCNGNTALSSAAFNGHSEIVISLVEKGANVNCSNHTGVTPLMAASGFGHLDTARLLLFRGAEVNAIDKSGHSALTEAALNGHTPLVELLLEYGSDINCVNKEGNTPLICAAQNGHVETMRVLLDEGADIEATTYSGDTALIVASLNGQTEAVEVLLDYGAKCNRSNKVGGTALITATFNGHLDIVQVLLSREADPHLVSNNGDTALTVAALNGHSEVAEMLLHHQADVNFYSEQRGTPLACAVGNNHLETAQLLLRFGAYVDNTNPDDLSPLMIAAYINNIDIVQHLLNQGADIHFCNKSGIDALHCAAISGHLIVVERLIASSSTTSINKALMTASLKGHTNVIMALLANGADVNFIDSIGTSPLMKAAVEGQTETMDILLQRGAHVDASDLKGNTSLLAAALSGQRESVALLLDHGAYINHINLFGATPLICAAVRGYNHIVQFLLQRGADINITDSKGNNALILAANSGKNEIVQILCEHSADYINCTNHVGNSPLIMAAAEGSLATVRVLLSKRANAELLNHAGYSALSVASLKGHAEVVSLLLVNLPEDVLSQCKGKFPLSVAAAQGQVNIVRMLLDKGADANFQNSLSPTALISAVFAGNKEIVQLLLENNADVNLCDERNITPLMASACSTNTEILQLLLDKGADVNSAGNGRDTALSLCAKKGCTPAVKILLDHKAEINHSNSHGSTPLLIAAQYGHLDIVRMLLQNNADVLASDNDGDSALHCAALEGHKDILQLLLDNGADKTVTNKAGCTPLQTACQMGHKGLVDILIQHESATN